MPHKAYFNLPEEKRERIRQAVIELFAELPYEEVTTRMIVQKAGISMGSLYQYFESKDEMYVYFIDNVAYHVDCSGAPASNRWYTNAILTDVERAFIDSMFRAPSQVLEQFYYSLETNAFRYGKRFYSSLQAEGLIPPDVDIDFYTLLQSGIAFGRLMYARSIGITSPEESRKFFKSNANTVALFGAEHATQIDQERAEQEQ